MALHAVHALAGGAHPPPIQAEALGVDDRLVAMVERVEPQVPVGLQQPAGRAENSGAPAARPSMGQEALKRQPGFLRGPDRVTADQGETPDDPVGDDRLPDHEPFLVQSQGERRQGVAAPPAH